VKNYKNWSTFADVLPFGARGSGNYDSPCRSVVAWELIPLLALWPGEG